MSNASKRFYGKVGYAPTECDDTGVATADIIEKNYYGTVQDYTTRWQKTENLNDDIKVSHRIRILADPYAIENFQYIKYVEWMGIKWEVLSTHLDYPGLVLSLGGVYNGDPC